MQGKSERWRCARPAVSEGETNSKAKALCPSMKDCVLYHEARWLSAPMRLFVLR